MTRYTNLDINTEKGQVTLKQEERAVEIFEARNPQGYTFVGTKKNRPVVVDGFLVKDGVIEGVVETKCRTMTYRELIQDFDGLWLVTFEKIEDSRRLASALSVPLYGFLYLVPNDRLLVQQISTEDGLYLPSIRIEATKTQKTVNGGQIVRNNAYIDMRHSESYRMDE